jgi:hypothetical protein
MDTKKIVNQAFVRGIVYSEYRQLIDSLLRGNQTTGDNHSEAMLQHTRMNVQRMKRLDKTWKAPFELAELVNRLMSPEKWLVITEGWCGDAAQTIPLMHHLAKLNPNIDMRLVLRDEHPELMRLYLTEGAKSIPILIRENSQEIISHWGPRPAFAQEMLRAYKNSPSMSYVEFSEKLHGWYARDKGLSFAKEIAAFLGMN